MRIGVFLPNWIGDVVMATPAIRALRKYAGPEGHLVGIMRPYVTDVLDGLAWLDETILYEKNPERPELAFGEALNHLRDAKLDKIVLLTNSFRTAWMARLSGARRRIGFRGNMRGWLLNDRVSRHQTFLNTTIDSYLRLATAAGCEKESTHLEVATTLADEVAANAVWDQLDLPPGEEVIVLNSGGAYGAAKSWPVEHFAKLAEQTTTDWGHTVLVNCGPAERDIAREIVAQAGSDRVKSLADVAELPIGLTKACIRRSKMLVSTDSGPRFFGIAFEKPVVTLFGPTDPAVTRTHYDGEVRMTLTLDCQPCMERTCPLLHHQCMVDLTPEKVYRVVAKQLQKPSSAAA